jgi:hypothetical protein
MRKSFIFMIVGILLGILILSIQSGDFGYNFQPNIPKDNKEIIKLCGNLDLEETSLCFRDQIKTFFKYKDNSFEYVEAGKEWYYITYYNETKYEQTNITIIEHLKSHGGKCGEWTILYKELCKETNFNCEQIHVFGENAHTYLVMSNSTHYCKIDQTKVSCSEITWN